MTNSITATDNFNRDHKTPAYVTVAAILLGATALAAAPASAADMDVEASLAKYINGDAKARHYVLNAAGLKHADWDILGVKLKRMRAPAININRPAGDYKVIAAKGVAMCPDVVFGNPKGSVMQQIEFINTVSNEMSVTKSHGTKLGVETTVEIAIGFGAGPVKGDSKLGVSVNHETTKSTSNTLKKTEIKTLRERSNVTLEGVGGKWAILWARVHEAKDIPYTAVFEPHPEDLVSFKILNRGQICLHEHVNYGGTKKCFKAGANEPNLGKYGWNDETSSISGTKGQSATYYKDSDYRGESWANITGSLPVLRGRLHDSISSLKVGEPKWVDVKYRLFKEGLARSKRQFRVSGKITVDMTQATQTRFVASPMDKKEFSEYCALSRGVGSTKSKRAASIGKRSGPVVADVPASNLAKMKFKAPK